MKSLHTIKQIIQQERRFGHLLHPYPDGDGLGSAMAVHLYLRKLKKESYIFSQDALPRYIQALPFASAIQPMEQSCADIPVLFTYDLGESKRLADIYKVKIQEAHQVINIDHHPSNDCFGTVNLLRKDAAATGEIVFDLLTKLHVSLDSAMATWLYLAIMTDTGNFRYSNTTAKTLRTAAALVEKGAHPHFLYRKVYEEVEPRRLIFLQKVLERMKREKRGKLVYSDIPACLFRKYKQGNTDTQDILDTMRSLKYCDVVILFKERKGKISVSFRSERTDVSKIAKQFGGGGHQRASATELNTTLEEAKRSILSIVRKEIVS